MIKLTLVFFSFLLMSMGCVLATPNDNKFVIVITKCELVTHVALVNATDRSYKEIKIDMKKDKEKFKNIISSVNEKNISRLILHCGRK